MYEIKKDYSNGTFSVYKWSKALYTKYSTGYDYVYSGYDSIQDELTSFKSAEGWLKRYVDPTYDIVQYDDKGNRIS